VRSVLAAAPTRGEAAYLRVIWADFSVHLSKNTELQVDLQKCFCILVMLATKLVREHFPFYREEAGVLQC